MTIQTTQAQKDAIFLLEGKGLIEWDLAFSLANNEIPIDENKIKTIVDKLDKQTQAYLYQRLQFKDSNGNPLGY